MRHWRLGRLAWVVASVALLASGACSSGSGGGSSDATAADGAVEGAASAVPSPGGAAQVATAPRSVVYRADLLVRVDDTAVATEAALDATGRAGGHLFSQLTEGEGSRESHLTLKVPSERFESVLDALAGLGRVLRRGVKAQDVSAQVVDLESRLRSARASSERLRSLLDQARTTSEVVAVEGELAKREAESEALQGRLRVLTDQVELATIDVRLTERDDIRVNEDLPSFLGGLRSGWVAVVTLSQFVLVTLGFLLPFLPFVALAVWLILRYQKRRRNRLRPTPPARMVPMPPSVQPPSAAPTPNPQPNRPREEPR